MRTHYGKRIVIYIFYNVLKNAMRGLLQSACNVMSLCLGLIPTQNNELLISLVFKSF